jgi:integrase
MAVTHVRIPKLQHHKASGQAKVRLRGRDIYLGPWGTAAAETKYRQVIGEFLVNGQAPSPPKQESRVELSVNELAAAFMRFAETHYVKNGRLTDEYACYKSALRPLKALYGLIPISKFGPVALKAVRQRMIENGWTRRTINNSVVRLRHMFKWGVENELVSPITLQALQAVQGLQAGRCDAPDPAPIEPVAEATIEKTLEHLSPVLQAMIRLQLLTGMRPGEVCLLRPCDLMMQMNGIWVYRPQSHKTEHHDRERRIYIGPEGQEVMRPFIDRAPDAFCFSPQESEAWRAIRRQANRKSKGRSPQLPEISGRNSKRRPGLRFTTGSYRRAIERACEISFGMPEALRKAPEFDEPERKESKTERQNRQLLAAQWRRQHCWNPNQLRHSRATVIREQYGMEAAQAVLGHNDPRITQIYAQKNFDLAARIMQQIG